MLQFFVRNQFKFELFNKIKRTKDYTQEKTRPKHTVDP